MKLLFRAALMVCCTFFLTTLTRAQSSSVTPVIANVKYPNLLSIRAPSSDGRFDPMLAVSGQSMQVTLQFTTDWANLPVVVQSLDGANVSYDGSPIAADGTLQFTTAAGTQPGVYRVQIIVADTQLLLQFWVPSPTEDSPPLLIPGGVQ
jgi:hypothetical protein